MGEELEETNTPLRGVFNYGKEIRACSILYLYIFLDLWYNDITDTSVVLQRLRDVL